MGFGCAAFLPLRFCVAAAPERACGPHYHVLGNHDTDADNLTKNGYTQEETKAFWGMDTDYYAFVHGGFRFVVLDGNDRAEGAGTDYPRHIESAQLRWLDRELSRTDEPILVLSHQSAENAEGLDNGAEVRALLEQANERAGYRRVVACFSGHHHLNDLVRVRDIPYVQVNSMSYFWVGEACENFAYPKHIHDAHPMLRFTAPYRDPLWSVVTLDPKAGELKIEGRKSTWAGRSPEELMELRKRAGYFIEHSVGGPQWRLRLLFTLVLPSRS